MTLFRNDLSSGVTSDRANAFHLRKQPWVMRIIPEYTSWSHRLVYECSTNLKRRYSHLGLTDTLEAQPMKTSIQPVINVAMYVVQRQSQSDDLSAQTFIDIQ
jgi:hypothetical protein